MKPGVRDQTVRDQLLGILTESPEPLTVGDILAKLQAAGVSAKAENPVRGRLTQLVEEGVVEKPGRGTYGLARVQHVPTRLEATLYEMTKLTFKERALRTAVLWDATPFLELTEDGAPGHRLVFEHADAEQLKDVVESKWPEAQGRPHVWIVREKGPLGDAFLEPDHPSPGQIPLGIVLVPHERVGGTGLTPQGYRTPFPERVIAEFLGLGAPRDIAKDVVSRLIFRPEFNVERAWKAAHAFHVRGHLYALLAAAYRRLGPEARAAFRDRMPGVVQAALEGSL